MTINVENLQLAIQMRKPCCFFCSFFFCSVMIVEHTSPSNNNAVILCLPVTTMLLYSNNGKLKCYKWNPSIHKHLWTGWRCTAQTAQGYFNVLFATYMDRSIFWDKKSVLFETFPSHQWVSLTRLALELDKRHSTTDVMTALTSVIFRKGIEQ